MTKSTSRDPFEILNESYLNSMEVLDKHQNVSDQAFKKAMFVSQEKNLVITIYRNLKIK